MDVTTLTCCLYMWLQIFQKAISSSNAYNDQFRYHQYLLFILKFLLSNLTASVADSGLQTMGRGHIIFCLSIVCLLSVLTHVWHRFSHGKHLVFFKSSHMELEKGSACFFKLNWNKHALTCSFVSLFIKYV